ncbi:hypothetical protein V6N11_028964 [Hibiscus sabdariffa]|uniref:Protein kinase domain-containing protein n=1 Tax=Hibiscus sabdariffa TaxID=183260 RepID=A0ABR2NWF3_9ROSI
MLKNPISSGEGGFGRVFKGQLDTEEASSLLGNHEFMVEVHILSMQHNVNLVTLIGYYSSGDQRLLDYEYMPMGSLKDHLFGTPRIDLCMVGHHAFMVNEELNICIAPVIYCDLKSANILLDNDFHPKLSGFGLGPVGDKSHVSTRVMGTCGYRAPEYANEWEINSVAMLLLELITEHVAIDITRNHEEQKLIPWSSPFLKDRKKHRLLAGTLMGAMQLQLLPCG